MKQFSAGIVLLTTLAAPGALLAQPTRAEFVTAPYMQRAYQAQERGDWAEVRRQTEQTLRLSASHEAARQLLIQALTELDEFSQAQSEITRLPVTLQSALLRELRLRWAAEADPGAAAIADWRVGFADPDWLALVQTHLFRLGEREGQQSAFQRALALLEMTAHAELLPLAVNLLPQAFDVSPDASPDGTPGLGADLNLVRASVLRLSEPTWRASLVDALVGRLVFLQRNEQAIELLLAAWPLPQMPAPQREQLYELALLTDDAALVARPGLRDEQYCLDTVAWLGERDAALAAQVLQRCDPAQDEPRWNFLASLYQPELLAAAPSVAQSEPDSGPDVEPGPAFESEPAPGSLSAAQLHQDALDAAYRDDCDSALYADAAYDAIRDELNAICLRQRLPGVATVFFARVLEDAAHPRREQLLREAAYTAYQAGDYTLALSYWNQVTGSLTPDERSAVAATQAAQQATAAPVQRPEDIVPSLTLEQLAIQAQAEPALYRLELGLRLSGHEDADLRASAVPWLEAARARDPYDFRIPETLAYRYHELAEPGPAIDNARRAIHGLDSSLAVSGASASELDEREFALRRTHQYLTQRNRVYIGGAWSRFGVLDAIGASPRNSAFQIASFEHLLGEYPDRGGRQLGVYARVLGSGTDNRRAFEDPAWGAGLRWKPLGAQNLNLYAEIFEPYRGDTDLMLRVSASLLDDGELRDDWRAQQDGWHWQSLYLDAAWFSVAENYQLYASYTRGYDVKLSTQRPHTVAPYVSLWSGHSRDFSDTAAGLGARYRHWFSQDTYSAWRNRVDIRLELYRSVAGDRKHTNGWRLQTEWML